MLSLKRPGFGFFWRVWADWLGPVWTDCQIEPLLNVWFLDEFMDLFAILRLSASFPSVLSCIIASIPFFPIAFVCVLASGSLFYYTLLSLTYPPKPVGLYSPGSTCPSTPLIVTCFFTPPPSQEDWALCCLCIMDLRDQTSLPTPPGCCQSKSCWQYPVGCNSPEQSERESSQLCAAAAAPLVCRVAIICFSFIPVPPYLCKAMATSCFKQQFVAMKCCTYDSLSRCTEYQKATISSRSQSMADSFWRMDSRLSRQACSWLEKIFLMQSVSTWLTENRSLTFRSSFSRMWNIGSPEPKISGFNSSLLFVELPLSDDACSLGIPFVVFFDLIVSLLLVSFANNGGSPCLIVWAVAIV
ncbi:hypothetical protein FGO68_gene9016 [Halteria grandinella]|uniref:Uncharacterized protein n=1 Tax=Halteria grandinella TaxID=5974 RepID=A0A8J8P2Z8_HALGN|nr:hypothetical protein FGO68_gene9016 [Halteria grandinella]